MMDSTGVMITDSTVITMAWNTVLVAIAGAFAKRWMNRVESDRKEAQLEAKQATETTAKELKELNDGHRQEMKEQAKEFTDDLTKHLDKIYNQMRIANGRTSALESNLNAVKEVCKERHERNGRAYEQKN